MVDDVWDELAGKEILHTVTFNISQGTRVLCRVCKVDPLGILFSVQPIQRQGIVAHSGSLGVFYRKKGGGGREEGVERT